MSKKRVEITFGAKDADLWEWLESNDAPKATVIKNILRMKMNNEKTINPDDLEIIIKNEVQKALSEIQIESTAIEEPKAELKETHPIDIFGGKEF